MRYLLVFLLFLSCSNENKKTYFKCSLEETAYTGKKYIVKNLLTIEIKEKKINFRGHDYEIIEISDLKIEAIYNKEKLHIDFNRVWTDLRISQISNNEKKEFLSLWNCLKTEKAI